jgi:queuine tRNA-ribosyltransferase
MIMKPKYFKTENREIKLPVFFPDATRAVIKTLDASDIEKTKTPGVLVNTYHLYEGLGKKVLKNFNGIRIFMSWNGGLISDSGGFQVMSIVKRGGQGKITDEGVTFQQSKKKRVLLSPEKSVEYQMLLKPDMVIVLDDFTPQKTSYDKAKESVERTLLWAKRSKAEYEKICQQKKLSNENRPYLLAVVQGGEYLDLREYCTKKLVNIGFDGLGYGGWPIDEQGNFNYAVASIIKANTPESYFLYGLGIGKPEEIVGCVDLGYTIFDCVLPTRDARHKRLYIYNASNQEEVNVRKEGFYAFYTPDKEKYYNDKRPVSSCCDCLLCTRYTRAYLAHLFRIEDSTAYRLATIHNLRFYSLLMEKLQKK